MLKFENILSKLTKEFVSQKDDPGITIWVQDIIITGLVKMK